MERNVLGFRGVYVWVGGGRGVLFLRKKNKISFLFLYFFSEMEYIYLVYK